ncbi:MAG: peptide deformylase [Cyanobacteria bacterium REEB459]|nr:peptide deformylase [Cyanobacteria bacterium REEB459]
MDPAYPLITVGDPRLRQPALAVTDLTDGRVQQLIDGMLKAVVAHNGVGLAAPQLAHPVRVLVLASRPNPRYPEAPLMVPTVVVNPVILAYDDHRQKGWEGCLSVPGQRGQVHRYRQIDVEYLDRQGKLCRQLWQGFVARIFQHEYDHLEGQLFLDRLESPADLYSEAAYQALLG